jgi:hypothetical protein
MFTKKEIYSSQVKPTLPDIDPTGIAKTMLNADRWLAWDFEQRSGKWAKVPKSVTTGNSCDATSHTNWCDFSTAFNAYKDGRFDGLGFALGDGWAGVDLDDCIQGTEVSDLAIDIVKRLDTYTEVSPSGTGLKMICKATLPEGCRKKNKDGTLEIYPDKRFFCITGIVYGDAKDANRRQGILDGIHAEYIGSEIRQEIGTSEGGVNYATLDEMLRLNQPDQENDGSKRLLTYACRAVEANLTDDVAIATIKAAAESRPFPNVWTDEQIVQRIRQAEQRPDVVRGSDIRIRVGLEIGPPVAETVRAFACRGNVYQNPGGVLVQFQPSVALPPDANADNGASRVAMVTQGQMLERMEQAAKFYYPGNGWERGRPCKELRRSLLERGEYPGLPCLSGVTCSPVLLSNGQIITTPGYNPQSGLFLDLEGDWSLPTMTNDAAIAKLSYALADFPFDSEVDKSAAIAMMLTLAARNIIKGSTPIFVVDGNRSGCGKGLLTDLTTTIVEGRRASRCLFTQDQDELRKRLTAVAMEGRSYILFDNVAESFGGHVLEAVLTSGRISDRILGSTKNVDLPLNVAWMVTANNISYRTPDIRRRIVQINLDTPLVDPSSRQKFKEPDLLGYAGRNRKELLVACLSLLANYLRAGCPGEVPAMGSFNEWSGLIRGALLHAGLADPCGRCAELREVLADETETKTSRLLAAWKFTQPTTVRDAFAALESNPLKFRALSELVKDHSNPKHRLGTLLRESQGVVVNGRCLQKTDHKTPKWFISEEGSQ